MSFHKLLADSLARDCRVCVHLIHKIPADLHSWRPTPGQRSVEELLRYLCVSTISAIKGMCEPDRGWRDHYQAKAKALTTADFAQAMEEQAQEILAWFEALPEDAFETHSVTMPWGETMTLGEAVVGSVAKWLPAYRMQLFLYLKQNGVAVSTPNLWRGVDPA